MKKLIFIICICIVLYGAYAEAAKTYIVGKPSTVSYYVEHTMGFSAGQFTDFDGTILLSDDEKKVKSVEVTIQTASLSTHNEERELGLKNEKFLNVEVYPEIKIKSKKITKDKIIADVTILGKKKEVTFVYFDYGVMPMNGVPTAMVGLQGIIDRTEYGIDYNVKSEKNGKDMLGTDFEITLHLDAGIRE